MSESIIFGIGAMLGFGTLNAFIARFSKPYTTLRWGFAIQFVGLVTLICYGTIKDSDLFGLSPLTMFIPGVLSAFAYLAIVRAFQTELASLVAPTISLWAVVTTVLSALFLNEVFTILKISGIVIALIGLITLTIDPTELKQKSLKQVLSGLRYAVYAALLLGIAFYLLAAASQGNDWVVPNTQMRFWNVATLLTIILLKGKNIKQTLTLPKITLGIGLFDALVMAVFNFGLAVGQAGVVSTVSSLNPLVTAAIGVAFLKEKLNPRQAIGIMITVLGIILLSV